MNLDYLTQIIVAASAIVTGMFFTIRYAINETNKSKDAFLDFMREMQTQQLEYYEKKNGHLERISSDFTKALSKISKK